MVGEDLIQDFPKEAYRKLLQGAQRLFETREAQLNLVSGLDLMGTSAERQVGDQPRPISTPASRDGLSIALGSDLRQPSDQRALGTSPMAFADELIDLLARRSGLEASVPLARRAIADIGPGGSDEWAGLLAELEMLQRKYRSEVANAPDVGSYTAWLGFDCRHPYALTDRFVGREDLLRDLDSWVSGDSDDSVRCLWALGGGGKSAIAWQWVSTSLTRLRHIGYSGAFWCSFYEQSFRFEEFMHRALAFCSQVPEADVPKMPRSDLEDRLLEEMSRRRVVIVLDGLERLMNGYAIVADRGVDLESLKGKIGIGGVGRSDRLTIDPRDGAFLRRLARSQAARVLITSRLVPADLEMAETAHARPHVVLTEIPGMSEKDALLLWASVAPHAPVESRELRAVLRQTGYHPLVISILARSVAKFKKGWIDWLASHPDFDLRNAASKAEAAIRTYVVETCLRDLPEAAYQLLGALTATGKPMQFRDLANVLLLGSRMNGDGLWARDDQVADQLQTLMELGFVGEAEPQGQLPEFDVHPVVRGAVWEFLTNPAREQSGAGILTEFWATPDRSRPLSLDELDKVIIQYQLLCKSGQLDRAWEIFAKSFWPTFFLYHDYRKLLSLFDLLLPDLETLQLLPLSSRRAQGDATYISGHLMAVLGESRYADALLRWCGAIRLQIGDFLGFLDAAHTRAWQTMYEGKLYETEWTLRSLKNQALAFRADQLRVVLDCWIGIVLALRGDKSGAAASFDVAEAKSLSTNWWVQGRAEGLVYLNEPAEALKTLSALQMDNAQDGPIQTAWERLTHGMAAMGVGDYETARSKLSAARNDAVKSSYKIIQCFALPCLAEIALELGDMEEVDDHLRAYEEIDPNDIYALSAADTWRVRARRQLVAGDASAALASAERAFTLAACDGPPFVYAAGLRRAMDTLRDAGAYVPAVSARLDPRWRTQLDEIASDEARLKSERGQLVLIGGDIPPAGMDDEDEAGPVLLNASPLDREWFDGIEGPYSEIGNMLLVELANNGITLTQFRREAVGPDSSLLVTFHRLRAERIIQPERPRRARDLEQGETESWLADARAHDRSLDVFLRSLFARQMRHPFDVHAFRPEDVSIFLKDHKRRIAYDSDRVARAWWEQLEAARDPLDMLILAECILAVSAQLADLIQEISINSDQGLSFAFAALTTRRATRLLETEDALGFEGWPDIDALLMFQDIKRRIGWDDASAEVQRFWKRLEQDDPNRLRQLLQLANELRRRGAKITDYHDAHLSTTTDKIEANLAYMSYLRLRNEPPVTDTWPIDATLMPVTSDGASQSLTKTERLSSDQLASTLEFRLTECGLTEIRDVAETWWSDLEATTTPKIRLRIADELRFRGQKLSQLRDAQIAGGTANIAAGISYLDYILASGQKASDRAREHNRVGNQLYSEKRFRDAVSSYEKAIIAKSDPVYFSNLAGAWENIPDLDRVEALNGAIGVLRRGLDAFPESSDLQSALEITERNRRTAELGGYARFAAASHMLPVVTPIAVEIDAKLGTQFVTAGSNDFLPAFADRLTTMRLAIKTDTGVDVPSVRVRLNDNDLPEGTYILMLDEVPLVSGAILLDRVFSLAPEQLLVDQEIRFKSATNPSDLSDGAWISPDDDARLEEPSWDTIEFLVRHLDRFIRTNLSIFAGMQELTQQLTESPISASRQIASDYKLIERFTRMAQALLAESVPIAPLEPLSNALLSASSDGMDTLLGKVRALAEFKPRLPGNETHATLFAFEAHVETALQECLQPLGDEYILAMTPEYVQEVLTAVRNASQMVEDKGSKAIVVRTSLLRRYVRKLVELEFPRLSILAAPELVNGATRREPILITLG